MSATFDLAEVGEAGVHNLDPTSGRSKDFAGERRKSHGNRDRRLNRVQVLRKFVDKIRTV